MIPIKSNLFGKQTTQVLLKSCTDSRHQYLLWSLFACLLTCEDRFKISFVGRGWGICKWFVKCASLMSAVELPHYTRLFLQTR